jgi:hypothetical protein
MEQTAMDTAALKVETDSKGTADEPIASLQLEIGPRAVMNLQVGTPYPLILAISLFFTLSHSHYTCGVYGHLGGAIPHPIYFLFFYSPIL